MTQSGDLVAGSHLPEPGSLCQYGVVKPLPQMLVGGSNRDFLKESECQGTRWENGKRYWSPGIHFPESFTASRLEIAP